MAGRRAAAAAVALLLSVVTISLVAPAAGHGVLIFPKSRNFLSYLQNNFNYAHGLSMGGVDVVSDFGKLTYPNGRRNYCGDAHNEYKWDQAGPIQTTYRSGQTIAIDVVMAVNHMGHFQFQVCPLDAKPGQGKCKQLYLKAPGHHSTKQWYLPGINSWGGGNWGGEPPRYGDGTFEAYQMPQFGSWLGWGCSGQQLCDMYKDMWVYRTHWMLPKGFTCDHCKLQWTWTTGHRCWPACDPKNAMAACKNIQMFGTCGSPGTAYPEEFVNCADVKIIDNAKIDWSAQYPPWNWKVDMKKGYWGTIKPSRMNSGE